MGIRKTVEEILSVGARKRHWRTAGSRLRQWSTPVIAGVNPPIRA